MKVKIAIGLIILLVCVAGGMLLYAWRATPQLVDVFPQREASSVPATSPIKLMFSRAMDEQTVNQRLIISPDIKGTLRWDINALVFTPLQAWPGGSTITITLEQGARAVNPLSFAMAGQSWSFQTNEATVAYLWPADGLADIFTLSPSSGTITQYTHGMGVLDFTVSNDGLRIFFSARNPSGGANLYQIDRTQIADAPDEANLAQVVLDCGEGQCRNPTLSADTHYLAYEYIPPNTSSETGTAQIRLLDMSTQKTSMIGEEGHETVQPSWSPSGLLAYYDRTSNGYEVFNLTTQERTLLTNQTGQPGDWNPDGVYYLAPEISYAQSAGETEMATSHIIRYDVLKNTSEDISKLSGIEDAEPAYSPDGSLIAFARKFLDAANWSLGRQLWIMNSDGTQPTQITDEADYNHYDIAWSLDGQKLAYVRFDEARLSKPPELWMINADGSDAVQLVIGGYSPTWIP